MLRNACDSMPCFNGGICIASIVENKEYECICLPGTNGTRCENNYDTSNAECICRPGYTGKNCENEIDLCYKDSQSIIADPINNPCANGFCIPANRNNRNRNLNFSCICFPGYTGNLK